VVISDETVRVYLFVATLGHSRRLHVRAFRHERQACWFEGLESAFRAFGGVPEEVLLDNTRALVVHHDRLTREVRFKRSASSSGRTIRPSRAAISLSTTLRIC
jgi:transposase